MKEIDIDIGGTFTDSFVNWDGDMITGKVDTTHYDLSVGVINAIRETSKKLHMNVRDLLAQIETIRYSTTVGMNKLIERKGPRLGLITTEGFEDVAVIGRGGQWRDGVPVGEVRNIARISKPEPLIPRELTVGVKERIDVFGKVMRPLDHEDTIEKIQYLVDRGVRGFVVSLLWSFMNPVHELEIKKLIQDEYPDSYLGSMPIFLSHDVMPKRYEYQRTMTTILEAYLHKSMTDELFGLEYKLRELGYRKPLMMIHNTGGMAEVYRTSAINTYNGGPVAGLKGSAYLGGIYGYKDVVGTDMGGTSFDIAIIAGGGVRSYEFEPVIDRWMVHNTMLATRSIGAGGGSIAWLNALLGNTLEVGPRSAGSMPGPACYNQGGTEATVTDADVILGYIRPDYFLGGRKRLDHEKAYNAIKEKIADPLRIDVEHAAHLIKRVVDGNMGNTIYKEIALRGYDPRNFILFAYGGGGPTHCCGYAEFAKISTAVAFPYSAVFCAFGSSTMDILHVYEQSRHINLLEPSGKYFTRYKDFNEVVESLKTKATRDITGEGFKEEQVSYALDLEMRYGGQINVKRVSSPVLNVRADSDCMALYQAFEKEYVETFSSLSAVPQNGVEIEHFILKATIPVEPPKLKALPMSDENPSKAFKEERGVYWDEESKFKKTNIYERKLLQPGNLVRGPAVIESEETNTVVAPSWVHTTDKYGNGVLRRQ